MNILKRNYLNLHPNKIKRYLCNPVIQDFLDTLVLLKKLDKSRSLMSKRMNEINIFMKRCRKHAVYYRKNTILLASYKFIYIFIEEYNQK